MSRIHRPHVRPPTLPSQKEIAEARKTQASGRTPEQVYADIDVEEVSPATVLPKGEFPGYRWSPKVLDEVMKKYGVGDTKAVLRTAIALDVGDRYLNESELATAAKQHATYRKQGYRWSPTVLADILKKRGIAEEGALLRAAERLDNGDKYLNRPELERAADVLTRIVQPNDLVEIMKRSEESAAKAGFALSHLGNAEGVDLPIVAIDVPSRKQPPRLRVIVTGGVHGDEPCGAGAAALLLEQLANDPRLSEDVQWTIVPVVNPRGLAQGTRRTPEDMDMNRNFVSGDPVPDEIEHMRAFLDERKGDFDLALDLHSGGAKRNGFWVLHAKSENIAAAAMSSFEERWPVLQGETKPYTLSSPGVGESGSTETLKDLARNAGARWSMTVEAPGSVAYLDQVLGENEIVHEAVNAARVVRAAEQAEEQGPSS